MVVMIVEQSKPGVESQVIIVLGLCESCMQVGRLKNICLAEDAELSPALRYKTHHPYR